MSNAAGDSGIVRMAVTFSVFQILIDWPFPLLGCKQGSSEIGGQNKHGVT